MNSANSELSRRKLGRGSICSKVCATLLLFHTCLTAAEGPYSALFRSRRLVTGKDLREIDKGARDVWLDGTKLFEANDPVRVIRDTTVSANVRGPFVEMSNGDVLSGRIVQYVDSGDHAGLPAHLLVELTHDPQTIQAKKTHIRVRADAVVRIVAEGQLGRLLQRGLIELKDGRRTCAESVRWTSDGLKALTADGVVAACFDQLTAAELPGKDIVAGVVSDANWQFVYPGDFLVRIHTTNGSQLTFPRQMVTRDVESDQARRSKKNVKQVEQIAVQPSWALEAILVPRDSIVFRSYRAYNEIPLSLLPVVAQDSAAGLHYWPWRKNQSVKGSTLRSGDIAVDLGFGMHSYSEITIQLPDAVTEFSSLLGMDHGVGTGGCVQCRLHAEDANGNVLWDSGFLRGEDGVKPVGPLSISGIRHLTLVTDFGHQDRPAGADPYDVRDQVAWLMPTVKIDASNIVEPGDLHRWLPKLEGWTMPGETFKRLELAPVWNPDEGRWETSMRLERNGDSSFRLSRQFRVSANNALLPIAVRRGGEKRDKGHIVRVEVNGVSYGSTMNGDIKTQNAQKRPETRVWTLGEYLGREIQVDVVVESLSKWSTGVIWDAVSPSPIVTGLSGRTTPLTADVPLVSLQPAKHNLKGKPVFQHGKLTNGEPLVVRGFPLDRGFGVPVGTELTYELRPEWRRFVAVIGLADGWKDAGPYQILLDGQPHWSSGASTYGRNDPAAQIDVAIPSGHKTITLVVLGSQCYGAWANSGFMLR